MRNILLIVFLLFNVNAWANSVQIHNLSGSGFFMDGSSIKITQPLSYEVIQRSGTSATFNITGTYLGDPRTIQYRWNGGSWTTLDPAPANGSFSGSVTIAQGQASLDVRFSNRPYVTVTSVFVGIGDIFLVAGQSNATGRGTNLQTYSSSDGFKATMFGNNYQWEELYDPYDDKRNQVDTVSRDTTAVHGSWVLPLATLIMNATHVPVAFIPCPMSGTLISQWSTPSNHQDRTTLYGSASYRGTIMPNGIKAILWYQGESDAQVATSTATYQTALQALADGWSGDLNGIKIVPALIATAPLAYSATNANKIRTAVTQAVGADANLVTGPDFSGLTADDIFGIHLCTDADLSTMATDWYNALNNAGLL